MQTYKNHTTRARTSLISLANIVQEQSDEIEKYQALLKLPEKVRQLQLGMEVKMEKLKRHVNMHLERMDKKTSITSVTISEIRSQVYKIESTIEESYGKIPEPDSPSWIFPGDIVEHMPQKMTSSFMMRVMMGHLPIGNNSKKRI